MNPILRKFLNFYTIRLSKKDNEFKYNTEICHTFIPKEEITNWNNVKFTTRQLKKIISTWANWKDIPLFLKNSESHRNYVEDTSIYGIEFILEFIPDKPYIIIPEEVKALCAWQSSDVPSTQIPKMRSERVDLNNYAIKLIDDGNYQFMSKSLVDERKEEDEYIEIIEGLFVYPDLDKIYNKLYEIIFNNIHIGLTPELFIKLLEDGFILGRELFLCQVDNNIQYERRKK